MEKIFIINKVGIKLSTIIQYPSKDKKYPVVLILHGFTGYKEIKSIALLADDLTRLGFVTVRFDASGFGESGGTLENDYRVSNYISDAEVVLEYTKQLSYVDVSRIGVCGHSLGAMLSILLATKDNGIKAICPISPPYKIAAKGVLQGAIVNWKKTGWFEKVSSKYGPIKVPYVFIEDGEQYNALDYVFKVKQPSLYILGTKDVDVPPEITKELYKKANQPKELIEIKNLGHHYDRTPEMVKIVNKYVADFFIKNLK